MSEREKTIPMKYSVYNTLHFVISVILVGFAVSFAIFGNRIVVDLTETIILTVIGLIIGFVTMVIFYYVTPIPINVIKYIFNTFVEELMWLYNSVRDQIIEYRTIFALLIIIAIAIFSYIWYIMGLIPFVTMIVVMAIIILIIIIIITMRQFMYKSWKK